MEEEKESLRKNETWDMVRQSNGRNTIGSNWVLKINTNVEGDVKKFKTWLVAKGYSQVERVKFGDIFSIVSNLTSIILLMYIASTFDLEIEQMDM